MRWLVGAAFVALACAGCITVERASASAPGDVQVLESDCTEVVTEALTDGNERRWAAWSLPGLDVRDPPSVQAILCHFDPYSAAPPSGPFDDWYEAGLAVCSTGNRPVDVRPNEVRFDCGEHPAGSDRVHAVLRLEW